LIDYHFHRVTRLAFAFFIIIAAAAAAAAAAASIIVSIVNFAITIAKVVAITVALTSERLFFLETIELLMLSLDCMFIVVIIVFIAVPKLPLRFSLCTWEQHACMLGATK
jgi:hypothetical protein